jgi:adenine-specific DNA-methyltransferase
MNPADTRVEANRYLTDQLITYIGNKRSLLGFIGRGVEKAKERLGKDRLRCFDVFSGSGVVARYLKRHSSFLHANDLERYAAVVNRCYLSNADERDDATIREAVSFVNERAAERAATSSAPGFISELYAPDDDEHIREGERVFYTTRNARFIDAARSLIGELPHDMQDYVLAPLLYEASVHANTSGVFKGFYKNSETGKGQFGGNGRDALGRILADIHLPTPVFSDSRSAYRVTQGDANEAARASEETYDLAYVDPPYNQHPYGSNYFMLNLIASYERPEQVSDVSGIPRDWNRSPYNKRQKIGAVFEDLIEHLEAKLVLISYNSEGFMEKDEMTSLLEGFGSVETVSTRYNAFRGSRNLNQRDLYVTEHLFLLEKS